MIFMTLKTAKFMKLPIGKKVKFVVRRLQIEIFKFKLGTRVLFTLSMLLFTLSLFTVHSVMPTWCVTVFKSMGCCAAVGGESITRSYTKH